MIRIIRLGDIDYSKWMNSVKFDAFLMCLKHISNPRFLNNHIFEWAYVKDE